MRKLDGRRAKARKRETEREGGGGGDGERSARGGQKVRRNPWHILVEGESVQLLELVKACCARKCVRARLCIRIIQSCQRTCARACTRGM